MGQRAHQVLGTIQQGVLVNGAHSGLRREQLGLQCRGVPARSTFELCSKGSESEQLLTSAHVWRESEGRSYFTRLRSARNRRSRSHTSFRSASGVWVALSRWSRCRDSRKKSGTLGGGRRHGDGQVPNSGSATMLFVGTFGDSSMTLRY